ncbi:NAD(P)-binding protein [Exidia glandulosa HHB12029]|uniref:NAD(P)-binding protein n=1 Tax=Exidia glandulosa HHB12029 TaxID=1314781 RepID=A0A165M0X1_EXIGL|nr:NAD(P)-binding protein [Exidia glandulosa HHB12029]
MTKKVISVFGATGSAGGSVAKYLLDDGTFAVRAVTRNVDSPAACALALGAEVVAADLDKPNTLAAALHGAYGVSGLTDFWSLLPKFGDLKKTQAAEETHGKALVDAAKTAGIKHFVWFSMWHCTPSVPHFESKYQVEEYLKASGVPYTVFLNAFYYENLTKINMLKKLDDGTYSVEIPIPEDTYIPSYSVDQSGGWILEAFKKPELYIGQTIVAVGEHLTPRQYAATLSKVLAHDVRVKSTPIDAFHQMSTAPDPFVVEIYLNLKYFFDHCQPPHSSYGTGAESKEIYPGQYTFEEFALNNEAFKKAVANL